MLISFFPNRFIGSILLHAVLNFDSISFWLLANLSFLAVLCSNSEANSFITLSLCSNCISLIKNLFILLLLLLFSINKDIFLSELMHKLLFLLFLTLFKL